MSMARLRCVVAIARKQSTRKAQVQHTFRCVSSSLCCSFSRATRAFSRRERRSSTLGRNRSIRVRAVGLVKVRSPLQATTNVKARCRTSTNNEFAGVTCQVLYRYMQCRCGETRDKEKTDIPAKACVGQRFSSFSFVKHFHPSSTIE